MYVKIPAGRNINKPMPSSRVVKDLETNNSCTSEGKINYDNNPNYQNLVVACPVLAMVWRSKRVSLLLTLGAFVTKIYMKAFGSMNLGMYKAKIVSTRPLYLNTCDHLINHSYHPHVAD